MTMNDAPIDDLAEIKPTFNLEAVLLILLSSIAGAFAAIVVLPTWLPGLSDSLLGDSPKAYWYLARASGVVAYVILWSSVAIGLGIKNKMAHVWPGGPRAVSLHEFASLFALALSLFHAFILMGDRYANYTLGQILIPFTNPIPGPLWVGVGQLAVYLMLPVAFSFYFRQRIGFKVWRTLHYVSFVIYLFVTLHGLFSGTDAETPGLLALYGFTFFATYFLMIYRVLVSVKAPRPKLQAKKVD